MPTSSSGDSKPMPERIVLSRKRGWRMPENTVKVDRTTQWGNPWRVEPYSSQRPAEDHYRWRVRHIAATTFAPFGDDKIEAAAFAVSRFRLALLHPLHPGLTIDCIVVRRELAGLNLACWCHDGFPCHGDVLLEAANT